MEKIVLPSNQAINAFFSSADGNDKGMKDKIRQTCGRRPFPVFSSKEDRKNYADCSDAVKQGKTWTPPVKEKPTEEKPKQEAKPKTDKEIASSIIEFSYKQSGSKLPLDEWKETEAGKASVDSAQAIIHQREQLKEGQVLLKILAIAHQQSGSSLSLTDWMNTEAGKKAKLQAYDLTRTVKPEAKPKDLTAPQTYEWVTPIAYLAGAGVLIWGISTLVKVLKGKPILKTA